MTHQARKNYYTGFPPKTRRGPSAAKLAAQEEMKAIRATLPPEPATVEDALAQCVVANRAIRDQRKIERPEMARRVISTFLHERWRETVDNLMNIIDPDPEDD